MKKAAISLLVITMITLLGLTVGSQLISSDSTLEISVLDVGQGDSIVVRTPDNVSLVIDASAGHQEVDALAKILPWNQRHLDYLLITHPDLDHYGGARWLLERYTIGQVLYNGNEANVSAGFKQFLADIRQRGIPLRLVQAGEVIQWPSGVHWKFLWPPADYQADNTNASCVVSKISWGSEDLLLPGDLPSEQEAILLTQQDVSAEIVKAGHHGSKFSSSSAWLQAVSPEWCLISAGRDNSYGHPNYAALQRLQHTGCRILSTIDNGTLSFRFSSTSIDYLTAPGWDFFGLPMAPLLAILNPLPNK
ncbi:MAG: MBL fold metallo-hydrolase [Candidatus Komeilibacteria bacterium]